MEPLGDELHHGEFEQLSITKQTKGNYNLYSKGSL